MTIRFLEDDSHNGETFKYQSKLPKLPIPDLRDTVNRYLSALKPLQSFQEHKKTQVAVEEFLAKEGPLLQEKLKTYATDKSSYIEEFWYDSYLQFTDPVVLNLNPFFLLEDDPTPQRNNQITRACSLIFSTLTFVHALNTRHLEPDVIRGTPLCMSQFHRLFATSRVPAENGCHMVPHPESRHIVVLAHSQFYYFQVFNAVGDLTLTEKEIAANLKAILKDASKTPSSERAGCAVGVLTTENRRQWAKLREHLESDPDNRDSLHLVDEALFIVCLDHVRPKSTEELANNMLCGTYSLKHGKQVGTCTNRWYDKLQIIVCENGSAGINFEHTGVDGHTVLRFVSDIYTDTILRFAKTINSQTQSIFHDYRQRRDHTQTGKAESNSLKDYFDHNPRKIEWNMTEEVELGVQYAETRLSDLTLQNEVKVLEFQTYGKNFITKMKMSPDAFVQMSIQAAYYGLYGKSECSYEPVMTKMFLHGRTEAIRTVTEASRQFVETFYSANTTDSQRLETLRTALGLHSKITRDCSKGLGQDRHLFALECLWTRLHKNEKLPSIFTDSGWATLNHTILSTSNCGNPALRLFGFGPVVANGFGIGYIIKDDRISFVASSKHRQTERLLQTLQIYLEDIKGMLLNEKYPTGVSQRQRILALEEEDFSYDNGYNYYDNGAGPTPSHSTSRKVGKRLVLHEDD